MYLARIAIARPTEDVPAASGDNPRDCPVFEAELRLLQNEVAKPGSGTLRTVDGELVDCHNPYDEEYTTEDELIIGQDVRERWVIITRVAKMFYFIEFEITALSSGDEVAEEPEDPDLCSSRRWDAPTTVVASVTRRPCGVSKVPQETDAGLVVVHDLLGSFLADRESYDIIGKKGTAVLVTDDESASSGEGNCKWMITFIDWWRWRIVLTHMEIEGERLKVDREMLLVWDHCKLPQLDLPWCCDEPSSSSESDSDSTSGSGSGSGGNGGDPLSECCDDITVSLVDVSGNVVLQERNDGLNDSLRNGCVYDDDLAFDANGEKAGHYYEVTCYPEGASPSEFNITIWGATITDTGLCIPEFSESVGGAICDSPGICEATSDLDPGPPPVVYTLRADCT